ncbi:MAG: PhzF family phenazine biosynthesis isomerase, partial [Bacteroidota bacterium]
QPFSGNPAAVVPLENWVEDDLMQRIAEENNLAETAFVVGSNGAYELRWFTPTIEVSLCGHATLATTFVLHHILEDRSRKLQFQTKSGVLTAAVNAERIMMDFPADKLTSYTTNVGLVASALGQTPVEIYQGRDDLLCILQDERQVEELSPDFRALSQIGGRGTIVTAASQRDDRDITSRCFYPQSGIDEDPVTGSAHTTLATYWAPKMKLTTLTAYQASLRGGLLELQLTDDRVKLSGVARLYLEGKIIVP